MAIDILRLATATGPRLAVILLAQAGVKPAGCDCEGHCGCQYAIDSFDIDVERIRIVDHGQERILRVMEVKP